MRNYRILTASVAPKQLDLALGLLYRAGLCTVHQHRRRNGIELKAEVIHSASATTLVKSIRDLEPPGIRIFKALRVRVVKKGPWASRYQKHLKPFPLFAKLRDGDENILIDPSGKIPNSRRQDTLYIEASLAFGTGTHPTTQLAARFLRDAMRATRKPAVLDLGCGTGILAMLAKRWGSGITWAVDNDPEALTICRKNLKQNRIAAIQLKQSLGDSAKRFDVIVANITADVLSRLRNTILHRLKPGGWLILTGLLYRDVSEIESAYRRCRQIARLNRRGWAALLLQKTMS